MEMVIIILTLILVLWIGFGFFGSRVREPEYSVISKNIDYEIREYEQYIEARVTVGGEYREAMSAGFRVLAGYIFGGNTSKQSIAMTAPVSEQTSQSIAMTAPVSETIVRDGSRVVSFVMPKDYTLATLPTPNDSRIEIVVVPAHKSAVLRYSGNNSSDRIAEKKATLLGFLKRDGIVIAGSPRSAGYNPPTTPPFMKRNEILVAVE
jgi:effector-binding domain-containing protein